MHTIFNGYAKEQHKRMKMIARESYYQFRSILFVMVKIFYNNSKNKTKQNNFYFISNLSPF